MAAKKRTIQNIPKDSEVLDLEKEKKILRRQIDELKENIRSTSETILTELESEKKQLRADLTKLKADLTKGNGLNNKLLKQIEENKAACDTLHEQFQAKQAEIKALSENHDFILPDDMTENVIDVTYSVYRSGRSYEDYQYNLTLHKEITVNRWFKKPIKRMVEQLVNIATSSYRTPYSTSSPEYTRMLNYYTAIKKHIKKRQMENGTKHSLSVLLHEANEVIVSSDIHEKDRFLLKVVDELKNYATL